MTYAPDSSAGGGDYSVPQITYMPHVPPVQGRPPSVYIQSAGQSGMQPNVQLPPTYAHGSVFVPDATYGHDVTFGHDGMYTPTATTYEQDAQYSSNPTYNQSYISSSTGEPSMRATVDGIPQLHMQQHHMHVAPPLATVSTVAVAHGHMPPPPVPMSSMPIPTPLMPANTYYMHETTAHTGMPPIGHVNNMYAPPQHLAAPAVYDQYHAPMPAQDYRFGVPQMPLDNAWQGSTEWEDDFDDSNNNVLYGNLEVKHRRRTTPEQLRVLEHWFSVNPRPDNGLREWLASELGITKRNVQVWFQNRRAKIKNLEKAAAADAKKDSASKNESTSSPDDNYDKGDDNGATSANTLVPPSMASIPAPLRPNVPVPSGSPRPGTASGKPRHQPLLIPVNSLSSGRRVSLAGGEAAMIEQWAMKRKQQQLLDRNTTQSANSPIGLAAAARRNSQPYPAPIVTSSVDEVSSGGARSALPAPAPLPSPKISPNGRMPSALHFTAMRNNTLRRASMPGAAQLISTVAFTPPRNNNAYTQQVPGAGSQPTTRPVRDLSPIRDHDGEQDTVSRHTAPLTFVTPPNSAYPHTELSSPSTMTTPSTMSDSNALYSLNPGLPFSPNSPLPNPTFSFGAAHPPPPLPMGNTLGNTVDDADAQQAIFMALQRGRLGSLASINSVNSVNTATTDGATETGSDLDWASLLPPGFDPDVRRASAPADLLHNIGLLGISPGAQPTNSAGGVIRPSPLAAFPQHSLGDMPSHVPFDPSGSHSAPLMSSVHTVSSGPYLPASNPSPMHSVASGSAVSSEGPSPSSTHTTHMNNLMAPPPLPSRGQALYSVYTDSVSPYSSTQMTTHSSLGPTLPLLPESSALLSTHSSSSSGNTDHVSFPSDFDLGYAVRDEDKDPFAFLADLNANGNSETINVLV